MPLYEYTCQKCQHAFETLVFGDDEAVECPECHGKKVERLLSLPGRPRVSSGSAAGLPMSCGEGPPCGAPWCKRTG
jgi:putative FmdB family regulatory protein